MCWAAGPAGSSLLFRIIDNRPARGTEERSCRANATLPLQLLLAATATGAENQAHRFVVINDGSRFPMCLSARCLCCACSHFHLMICIFLRYDFETGVSVLLNIVHIYHSPARHLICAVCLNRRVRVHATYVQLFTLDL